MKRVARWITGILFGVAVVAVADDYVHTRNDRWDKKLLKGLDAANGHGVDWNYTD